MEGTETYPAQEKETPRVHASLQEQEKALATLWTTLARLEDRLFPVLSSNSDSDGVPEMADVKRDNVAYHISDNNNSLRRITQKLQNITERLEV